MGPKGVMELQWTCSDIEAVKWNVNADGFITNGWFAPSISTQSGRFRRFEQTKDHPKSLRLPQQFNAQPRRLWE
jgi:hypothetical protein